MIFLQLVHACLNAIYSPAIADNHTSVWIALSPYRVSFSIINF